MGKVMQNSLKEKLDEATNVKNMMMNGANKATALFESATTDNRVLRNENADLKQEVLKNLSKIKDLSAAHEFDVCNWITEKGALEQELERERALNLKLEQELAMKRGEVLVLEDEKRLLQERGLFERVFRVGEKK